MVAISRLDDYRHDVLDVTCGSILGLLAAYFSYRRYYPPLWSLGCDIPYDRTDLMGPNGFAKLADDEEQQLPRSGPFSPNWEAGSSYQLGGPSAVQAD